MQHQMKYFIVINRRKDGNKTFVPRSINCINGILRTFMSEHPGDYKTAEQVVALATIDGLKSLDYNVLTMTGDNGSDCFIRCLIN
jgi:hypothetical protein